MTPTDLNEAPYPPEIKARGWGFDIDVERIEASETWALAGPELRPWLLMTWITAWRSQPVGTMPASPRVFAARIGMHWVPFQDAADVLMRGWVQHADGLLYHPVITERVLAMAEKRLKDSVRVATWRARNAKPRNTLQTGDTDATDVDVTRDQHVSTTPLPLPIPKEDKERAQGKPAVSRARKKNQEQTFSDWYTQITEAGEKAISGYAPVWTFAEKVGLPQGWIDLAWHAFKRDHLDREDKRQIDWRKAFANYLRGNYLNLWKARRDGTFFLSDAGVMLARELGADVPAESQAPATPLFAG